MVASKKVHRKVHRKVAKKTRPKKMMAVKSVHVPKRPRYCKPGAKSVVKDRLHKCGPKIKTGKHKGMCKVVLSKQGQKVRARQLARKAAKKSKK